MSNKGSCLCGEVHFDVEGDFESFFLCHCSYCRKDTGSAHASNLFSTKASLTWLSGQHFIKVFNVPGTRHVKSFCSNCGSALPNLQMNGQLLVVPAGSLDDEVSVRPNAHLFTANKANWDQDLESIPQLPGLPT